MPGDFLTLGPFTKGLHNSAGSGEYIDDAELFQLENLEVDTDGSLANRPAIVTWAVTGLGSGRCRVLGVFVTNAGSRFVIVSYSSFARVGLINADTNTLTSSQAVVSDCVVQYNNRLYVISTPGGGTDGGYFDASGAWTSVAAIPKGNSAAIYKERMWVAAGIDSTSNTSRLYFSAIGDPTSWGGSDFIDVEPGNGQKLAALTVLNNDIILFKEHSTFRAGYTSDVRKIEISKISNTIGVPGADCAVTYDNNNIYLIHDNSVYELYNYTFTKLSANINMSTVLGGDIYTDEKVSLTLFRNRLFVRYYNNMYVYSLLSGRWSSWKTVKKFSRVVVLPDQGGDTAYAHSITSTDPGILYKFQDDRVTGVQSEEDFTCTITTKTYDFDASWAYKVLFWWGMTLATSGTTTAQVVVPNSKPNNTWQFLHDNYTWESANSAGIKWSNADNVIFQSDVSPGLGTYARKFLKFKKKLRFRQAYFKIITNARANSVGDAVVRIFDIVVFVNKKQTVVKEIT